MSGTASSPEPTPRLSEGSEGIEVISKTFSYVSLTGKVSGVGFDSFGSFGCP